jgi:hypothetical protein
MSQSSKLDSAEQDLPEKFCSGGPYDHREALLYREIQPDDKKISGLPTAHAATS